MSGPLGLRDRALMELLYSTGMRRKEAVSLSTLDVDAERGTVLVRQGKGQKDRVVPVGERALAWLAKYLADARPKLVRQPGSDVLFSSDYGGQLHPDSLTSLVRGYVRASGVKKRGARHLFRQTMATLMLESGADVRFIQAILGHEELTTTEVYTRVTIRQLRQVLAATHPAERRERGKGPDRKSEATDPRAPLIDALEGAAAEEEGG